MEISVPGSSAYLGGGFDSLAVAVQLYLRVHVQVVKGGGENNLHTHPAEDAFWYVINGAVRFYGEGDKVIGVYNTGEGILIPRGFKYWFESASDERNERRDVGSKSRLARIVWRS